VTLPVGECFYHRCEAASYRQNVLCCSVARKQVIDMQECPRGFWVKDEAGFPVEGGQDA
jgi:hypothetical protein